MTDVAELWRPIPGFEEIYEVSDRGRVRSVPRNSPRVRKDGLVVAYAHAGKDVSAKRHPSGYARCTLFSAGKGSMRYIHDLVLTAFVGPRPDGAQACHENGVRNDNRLANLRWDTPSANQADRARHGTGQKGMGKPFISLTEREVDDILTLSPGRTISEVARLVGRPRTTVADVLRGRTWAGGKRQTARGVDHFRSRLDPDKVRWIRDNAGSMSISAMARELGVCWGSVSRVAKGDGWTHI